MKGWEPKMQNYTNPVASQKANTCRECGKEYVLREDSENKSKVMCTPCLTNAIQTRAMSLRGELHRWVIADDSAHIDNPDAVGIAVDTSDYDIPSSVVTSVTQTVLFVGGDDDGKLFKNTSYRRLFDGYNLITISGVNNQTFAVAIPDGASLLSALESMAETYNIEHGNGEE